MIKKRLEKVEKKDAQHILRTNHSHIHTPMMDKIEKNKGLALPSREYLHECVEGKRRKKMLNFFLYSDKKKTFLCKYVDKKKMMEQ